MSELSDFVLPFRNTLIVLPDEGDKPNTGTIVKSSPLISGLFAGDELPYTIENHIIFVRELTVQIEFDGTNYLLMNKNAVMGLAQ